MDSDYVQNKKPIWNTSLSTNVRLDSFIEFICCFDDGNGATRELAYGNNLLER